VGDDDAIKPQFEFGFGLSYTSFAYSNHRHGKQTISHSDELPVSISVKNTGRRGGQEVVQLYVSDLVATIAPAGKRLKRFVKLALEPGEERTINFTLRREDLSFIGKDNRAIVEPGDFEVM